MTHKLTVTHDGQTFTRKTERTYTHVVLVRNSLEKLQQRAARYAPMSRDDAAYYLTMIDGSWRRSWQPTAEDLVTARKISEMGLEAYNQERVARAVLREAKEFNPGWFADGWCGRLDLAQKLAHRIRTADYSVAAEVVIVPVPQP